MHFEIRPEYPGQIRWFLKGHCGEAGCTEPECCCSICGEPIGTLESDPRWDTHDEGCDDCDLCRDQAPLMLFSGEGKAMERAQFHTRCFEKIARFE